VSTLGDAQNTHVVFERVAQTFAHTPSQPPTPTHLHAHNHTYTYTHVHQPHVHLHTCKYTHTHTHLHTKEATRTSHIPDKPRGNVVRLNDVTREQQSQRDTGRSSGVRTLKVTRSTRAKATVRIHRKTQEEVHQNIEAVTFEAGVQPCHPIHNTSVEAEERKPATSGVRDPSCMYCIQSLTQASKIVFIPSVLFSVCLSVCLSLSISLQVGHPSVP
jgi:hypothetical protein